MIWRREINIKDRYDVPRMKEIGMIRRRKTDKYERQYMMWSAWYEMNTMKR